MIHLITPADIVADVAISLNSEPHKLAKAIPLAQARHLRPLLGYALFTELLAFAELRPVAPAALPPATAEPVLLGIYAAALSTYQAQLIAWEQDPFFQLLKQCRPMLSAWSVVEAWPSLLGHITAAGIVTKVGKSEGTTSADERLVGVMFDGIKDQAVFQSEELRTWIHFRAEQYPAFIPSIKPVHTGRLALGGIYLLS